MNDIGRTLSTVLGRWERPRGGRPASIKVAWRPDRCAGRRLPGTGSFGLVWVVEALYILPSLLPPLLSPRAFFPFSRVELCFYPLSFSLPSFLHTGCWNHHPLEQRSPSFISLPLSAPIFDIKQTWGTSFGTSTPALSLSLRAFVSPLFSLLPSHFLRYHRLTRLTALLSRSHIFLQIPSGPAFGG